MKDFIWVGWNEASFKAIEFYKRKYPSSFRFFSRGDLVYFENSTESEYDLLEPWIQWRSVYLGLSAEEHRGFHLHDSTNRHLDRSTVFQDATNKGYRVVAISPFNLDISDGVETYVPDAWSNESVISKTFSERLFNRVASKMIRCAVCNNSRFGAATLSKFGLCVLALWGSQLCGRFNFFKIIYQSFRHRALGALLLDLALLTVWRRNCDNAKGASCLNGAPVFAYVFLNGLAHIQHHVMLRSEWIAGHSAVSKESDPLFFALSIYDNIFDRLFPGAEDDVGFLISTALSQAPYDREKFYYRPINHEALLHRLSISYDQVQPLMSRDFIVTFGNPFLLELGLERLKSITANGFPVFGNYDLVDEKKLFVTVVYGEEVHMHTEFRDSIATIAYFKDLFVLVARKNGMHSKIGYNLCNFGADVPKGFNVKDFRDFFQIKL